MDLSKSEFINCTVINEDIVKCDGVEYSSDSRYVPGDTWFWIYLGIYVALVLLAGIFSGLTLGLLSLDTTTLEVMIRAGTPSEQKNARCIMPLIKRHHLLLVTLLLANAAAVESMPLFMNKISNEIVAIVVSVTAVLLFGEVFPQALCSRYGLAIGATLVPLVYFLMFIFFIIAWPIAKLLDCLLGKDHATFYRRSEIKAIVDIHGEDIGHGAEEDPLSYDEVLIIKSALDMKNKVGLDAMKQIKDVFMLDIDTKLDTPTMKKITEYCHSRIPIYENTKDNVVAVLLVKTIISLDPDDATPLRDLVREGPYCRKVFKMDERTPLYDLLNEFQKGKSHLCLMTRKVKGAPQEIDPTIQGDVQCILSDADGKEDLVGIITLEDVIEELLGEEIIDESDMYRDVNILLDKAKRRASSTPQGATSRQTSRLSTGQQETLVNVEETSEETKPLLD